MATKYSFVGLLQRRKDFPPFLIQIRNLIWNWVRSSVGGLYASRTSDNDPVTALT